jgi:hypothetical protein
MFVCSKKSTPELSEVDVESNRFSNDQPLMNGKGLMYRKPQLLYCGESFLSKKVVTD